MELMFRQVRPDEVEQELTQKDQFNTDRVPLAATLVRESHQNSTDARADDAVAPVRIRIAFTPANATNRDFWLKLLGPLAPHLAAADIGVQELDLGAVSFLVIEDFGTTGLRGSVEAKDEDDFSDFWRRVGRSHKATNKGGSWGLGKLVFPASSQIRTFFGLTIRDNDPARTPLLMGQTVLTTHRIGGIDHAPHGFFGAAGADGFQLPVSDPAVVAAFAAAVGFRRTGEPGLSIAIPFPQEGLRPEKLLPLIVENYFFPILTGQLEVECGSQTVSVDTFDTVAGQGDGHALVDADLIRFIREIDLSETLAPQYTLPDRWGTLGMGQVIPEAQLQELRATWDAGRLVHVEAPLTLRPKAGGPEAGAIDLFLRRAPAAATGRALFIRGSTTVPNEESNFRNRNAFAALVASEGPVSRFLRDAENPAHTSWNGNAEKLTRNWRAPSERLREIRHSLRQLHELIDQGLRREEPEALKFLVSLQDRGAAATAAEPNPTLRPARLPAAIAPGHKLYAVSARKGGFTVRGGPDLTTDRLPLKITVRAAYDLPSGNPFSKFSRYDFDFRTGSDIKIGKTGANCSPLEPNVLELTAVAPEFTVEVTGFDIHRDLVVGVSE